MLTEVKKADSDCRRYSNKDFKVSQTQIIQFYNEAHQYYQLIEAK